MEAGIVDANLIETGCFGDGISPTIRSPGLRLGPLRNVIGSTAIAKVEQSSPMSITHALTLRTK
jgi:hypothetical protein